MLCNLLYDCGIIELVISSVIIIQHIFWCINIYQFEVQLSIDSQK